MVADRLKGGDRGAQGQRKGVLIVERGLRGNLSQGQEHLPAGRDGAACEKDSAVIGVSQHLVDTGWSQAHDLALMAVGVRGFFEERMQQ